MLTKTAWTLIGFLLLWLMPGARVAHSATESERQGQSQAQCFIMADPMCERKEGRTITFTVMMMNGFDQTRHFVVTQDMAGAFLITLEPSTFSEFSITLTVSTATYRLHPKAWCRIFDENQLPAAELLQLQAQAEVDKITKFRVTHTKVRTSIAGLEGKLEAAIAASFKKPKEPAIQKLKTQIETKENNDESTLNKIKGSQDAITTLYGEPPEAEAFIVRLSLVGYNTDFKKVSDAEKEQPGIFGFANIDDDDKSFKPDRQETNVKDEDDLYRLWWYFARPVDSPPGMTVSTGSAILSFFGNREKSSPKALPSGFSGTFLYDGAFVEAQEASTNLQGELLSMVWLMCQDKAAIKAMEVNCLDQNGNKTNHLHIAKWENGLDGKRPNEMKVKDNFIRVDPDRFYAQVKDIDPPNAAKATVKIRTLKKDDTVHNPELEFEIDAKGGGIFEMPEKPQMLMADKADDQFSEAADTGQVADDAKNDRTYIVECEGTLRMKYKLKDTTEREFTFHVCEPDPKEIRIIKVNFVFPTFNNRILAGEPWIDNNGDDVHNADEPFFDVNGNGRWDASLGQKDATKLAKLYEQRLNELYAQTCVRFQASGPTFPAVPAALASGNILMTEGAATGLAGMSPDEQAIFNAGMNSGTDNDVEVYFWKRIRKGNGAVGGLSGRSFTSDFYRGMPAAGDINDTAFINTAAGYFVIGHEVGHIVRQDGTHADPPPPQFLFDNWLSPILQESEVRPVHSKRIRQAWADRLRSTKGPNNSAEYAEAP